MNYNPQGKNKKIIERAWEHLESVPYTITLRWLFYRLLGDGLYSKKEDYDSFKNVMATARKRFYQNWHPSSIADDTRSAIIRTGHHETEKESLEGYARGLTIDLDLCHFFYQEKYVELWFEAKAMKAQFEWYTEAITLVPFGGDASIPYKWQMAKRIEEKIEKYRIPATILYFGDCDEKGQMIPYSAIKDIQNWCSEDFDFKVCGLTLDQAEKFQLPENFEKPGQYQWEALSDPQAKEIITTNMDEYIDAEVIQRTEEENKRGSERLEEELRDFIQEIIERK